MDVIKTEQEKVQFPSGEKSFTIAYRRWLVKEILSARMSKGEAIERFDFGSKNPEALLRLWLKRYAPNISLTLPAMSEEERQKMQALERLLADTQKQFEDAQMKNTALETMIDVAEQQFKINIRKKSGPKQ